MADNIYFIYLPKPYLVNPNAQLGLGLLCLATYAKELGAEVHVLNAQNEKPTWEPDVSEKAVVCISGCLIDIPILNNILRHLHEKGCFTAVGGPVSKSRRLIHNASLVIDGIGEPWMECLVQNKFLPGRNFGNYPIPDRSLLGGFTGGNIFHSRSNTATEQSTTLMTSRGCLFNCSFCSSGSNSCYYEYDLERIDRELNHITNLGITDVRINDDNIITNEKRLRGILPLLKKYEIRWRASLRTKPNDVSMYELMKDSGCIELSFGVESYDEGVLKVLKKGAKTEDSVRALRNAVEAGIPNVRALMMMGTPGETKKTLELNKEFVDMLPGITVCMCMFYPFPGTDIYAHPHKYGITLENLDNPNIYAYRADESAAEAHISIKDGLSRDQLTHRYHEMIEYLESKNQNNPG